MRETNRQQGSRRWIIISGGAILLVAAAVSMRPASFHDRIQALRIGQTQVEVQRIMGRPDMVYVPMPPENRAKAIQVPIWWYLSPEERRSRTVGRVLYRLTGQRHRTAWDRVQITFDRNGRVSRVSHVNEQGMF